MSRIIASILGQPEHLVKKTVGRLEAKNGYPSHDVRHLADNIQKTRAKVAELGLDPDDTTGEELYQALLLKFQQDSRLFDNYCQLPANDFSTKASKAIELISNSVELPQRWTLKDAIAKDLLRTHLPKKTMKQLNYRSIESLLKRENIGKFYIATGLFESTTWVKQLGKLVSKQDSTSFIPRRLNLIALSIEKQTLSDSNQPVIYNDDTNTIALIETNDSPDMPLLSMVIEIIDSIKSLSPINLSEELSNLCPAVVWWSDMDGLMANLNNELVSLNIKDVSLNSQTNAGYSSRQLDSCRNSFWRNLIQRYENQLEIQEDALSGIKDQIISFHIPANQPAFEYVEDI